MRPSPAVLEKTACPLCGGGLGIEAVTGEEGGRIREGRIACRGCAESFPIANFIPRFVSAENYAGSFGLQWNRHARTQLDRFSGIPLSRNRFFQVTRWPERMAGKTILEAGCGAGRFTQVALETGAEVYSFDYSNAVDANLSNNGLQERLNLFQADIFRMPFRQEAFDHVFCLGVLQHTPDPKKAFFSLVPFMKRGGTIAIDIYDLTLRAFVNPKYWLRPLTRRLPPETLYRIVETWTPRLFPLKRWITERVPFGKYPAFFIPVAYHRGFIPEVDGLSDEQLLEWSILDTFDKFAPRYDKPQRIGTVRKWFTEAGLEDVFVSYGPNGIVARGVKP